MALAEEAGRKESKDVKDEDMRARIEEEERKVQVQRGRWRLMRETAAAVVTGSGVDWVREEGLRELVLDEGSGEE